MLKHYDLKALDSFIVNTIIQLYMILLYLDLIGLNNRVTDFTGNLNTVIKPLQYLLNLVLI
jgi:hypothetical protein